MFEPQEIRSEHKDVIHDVLYDYYGQRIATCSSDQTVKVNYKCPFAYVAHPKAEPACESKNALVYSFVRSFVRRFGTKMKKAPGLCRPHGKHTPVRCGG